MHYQVVDNFDSFTNRTLSSCANTVITHIGSFLAVKEQIQFAASNRRIKANVFYGSLNVLFPVRNLTNLKQFLSNNSHLKSLRLSIEESGENPQIIREFFPKITKLSLKYIYPDLTWFDGLTKLRVLSIVDCRINISICANFPMVSQLTLYNYRSSFNITMLRLLPLEQLMLNACPYIKLTELTNLIYLKRLLIKDYKTVAIPSFEGCCNLQSISLERLVPSKLEPLYELKELKQFFLDTNLKIKRPLINIDFLQNCKALTTVILSRIDLNDLSILNTCPSLKKVWISSSINLVSILPLTQLPRIKEISVIGPNLDITNVVTFPSTLTRLELEGKIIDGNIRFTSEMRAISFKFKEYKNDLLCFDSSSLRDNLTTLDLSGFILAKKEEEYISGFSRLTELCVKGITDNNIYIFSNLINLKHVIIYSSNFTTFNGLQYCINITTLHMINNSQLVNFQALKYLYKLRKIIFNSCSGIASCLAVLKECPNLISIKFSKCGPICLTPLKECSQLQRLQIGEKNITRDILFAYGEEVYLE